MFPVVSVRISVMNENAELPLEIDVRQVKELLDKQVDFLFLDCREPDEHQFCRVAQAQLIPLREIPGKKQVFLEQAAQRVVVMCHHGMRSMNAAQWLRANGIVNAQSMAGGIEEWSLKIDPSVPRY